MKTLLLVAALVLAPLSAQAASGFCAARVTDQNALVTVPKDTESKEALTAEFEEMLRAANYEKTQIKGKIDPNPMRGCLVYKDSDTALLAMKNKMLEIQKTLGLQILITGW